MKMDNKQTMTIKQVLDTLQVPQEVRDSVFTEAVDAQNKDYTREEIDGFEEEAGFSYIGKDEKYPKESKVSPEVKKEIYARFNNVQHHFENIMWELRNTPDYSDTILDLYNSVSSLKDEFLEEVSDVVSNV